MKKIVLCFVLVLIILSSCNKQESTGTILISTMNSQNEACLV